MSKTTPASLAFVLGLTALPATSGCASLTGLVTGAFTGAVDAPAQVYRTHRDEFAENPINWPANLFLFVPLGFVFGPLTGLCKGVALDMQWVIGQQQYAPVFGSYGNASIWRPYTLHW